MKMFRALTSLCDCLSVYPLARFSIGLLIKYILSVFILKSLR